MSRILPPRLALSVFCSIVAACPAFAQDWSAPRPTPKYEVRVEKNVLVRMSDGVHLATDLYFPVRDPTGLPAILIQTPYNKNLDPYAQHGSAARMFASQGFVTAVQDKRGRWASEGRYGISEGDLADVPETIQWLASQPWSNGNVGLYGCSNMGETQIIAAPTKPPALKAMIPQAAGGAVGKAGGRYRFFGVYNGGALELAAAFGWIANQGSRVYYRPPSHLTPEEVLAVTPYFDAGPKPPKIDYRAAWNMLPIIETVPRLGITYTPWTEFLARDLDDKVWDEIGYLKDGDTIDAPALHVNSWYDLGVADTLFTFNYFREQGVSQRARDNQYAIISPTSHCLSEFVSNPTIVGQRDLGDARFGYWDIYVKWFGHWLAGEDNDVLDMPRVQYYVMGRNAWSSAAAWPVPGTRFVKYYLRSGGRANGMHGDGALSTTAPKREAADSFVYDPAAPVPTIGGLVCCTGTADAPEGPLDQRAVEMRNDVLVYSTPPLQKGIEVTGPIQAVLYVSSEAKDTDFTAKLVDVYPDGTAYNLQEGILRARYREGFDKEVWMGKGQVYEIRVDLHATSNYFEAGHRIRLEISSSNFPRFDRNLNTGEDNEEGREWATTRNTIRHSGAQASYVVLPVIPEAP
jgi:putative CocE/NonD family hydrolase